MKSLPSLRVLALASFIAVSLLPIGFNRFDYPTHAGLVYALGGMLLFLLILSWRKLIEVQTLEGSPWLRWENILRITAVILPILCWIAFALSPIRNFGWSEVVVLSVGIVIMLITRTFSTTERRDFVRLVVLLAVLASILGLFQYLMRDESRVAGPFYEMATKARYWPNAFALFLLLMWPLSAVVEGQGKPWRALRIFSAVTTLAALTLTFSRAAILTAGVQIVVMIWMARHTIIQAFHSRSLRTTFLAPLIAVVGALVIIGGLHAIRTDLRPTTTNSFAEKATFAGTEKQTSFSERAEFMKGALILAQQKPFFGYGPFSFRFIYSSIQNEFLAVSDHPHNWYLKIAMEEGIPAALLFILLLTMILYARRDLFNSTLSSPSSFILIAILGVLLHDLADYNLNFLSNQIAFWAIVGLLIPHPDPSPVRQGRGRWWGTLTLIASIALTGAILVEGILSVMDHPERTAFARNTFFVRAKFEYEQGQTLAAISDTEYHLRLNPLDAYAWDFLGRILEPSNPHRAIEAYDRAIIRDGANDFGFYVHYLQLGATLGQKGRKEYERVTEQAKHFLRQYPVLAEQNVHYTAQTANATHAIELAKLLGENDILKRIEAARKRWTQQRR